MGWRTRLQRVRIWDSRSQASPLGVVLKVEWTDHEDRLAAEWLRDKGSWSPSMSQGSPDGRGWIIQFQPVRAYLQGLRWDGVERLKRWLSTYLGFDDIDYTRAAGSRWLISAVARIFRPEAKADCCLIL